MTGEKLSSPGFSAKQLRDSKSSSSGHVYNQGSRRDVKHRRTPMVGKERGEEVAGSGGVAAHRGSPGPKTTCFLHRTKAITSRVHLLLPTQEMTACHLSLTVPHVIQFTW